MDVVTWLHLSDLHLKSEPGLGFNRKVVLEALWNDIDKQIAKGIQPDFVVFTGDVAYRGTKREYELAGQHFFDPLLDVTGLSKDQLFIVPGNHDIDWDEIDPLILPGMCNLLTDRDQINQFLGPKRDRSLAFRKFSAYAGFVNAYFGGTVVFSDKEYFYTRIIETRQKRKIAILGLNSVWMSACQRNPRGKPLDQGNLLIGERQIEDALANTKQADLRIALLHHPVDWLHETDRFRITKRLSAQCDLVLHGHWHEPQVNYNHTLSGQAVYIPAGAVYASRTYPNGYNLVQLDLDSRQLTVYLRRYEDDGPEGPEWTKDIKSTGEERDGMFKLNLFQTTLEVTTLHTQQDKKKVLFVEDTPSWQNAIQSVLVSPYYDLQIASSFEEATNKLGQTSFDLILINLCLESDNDYAGVMLLEDLVGSNIPRIVLTGVNMPTRELFEQYKVYEVFVKGKNLNKARFRQVVQAAIA